MSELLVRSKNGIKLYKFEKTGKNEKGEPKYTSKITFEYHGYIHDAIWSVDGSCFLILHSVEGLLIIRNYEANRIINKITCCSKYKDLFNSENVKLIKNVQWSPKNKFIVFFFPYDEQKHSQLGNLLLWSVTYNKVFYSFKIKKKICSNWPIINFTNDDNYFFLLNKFDIYVYDALYLLNKSNNSLSLSCDSRNSSQKDAPKDYVFSWSQSNVTALYISPYVDENHCRYLIVHTKHNFLGGVFIYKIEGLHNYQNNQKLTNINYYQKGQNVIKYDYIKSKNESTNGTSNMFAFATNGVFNVSTNKCENPVEVKEIKLKLLEKKTFDNMDNLNCLWSASGKYVSLLVHTNDTTNKSYGYLCNCFYFSLVSANYTLKKINEQIAQDVKWNKSEDEFLIIEGRSENIIILYGFDLKVKCKFFSQYKNTIKWCPFGNMIAIGGFGNLAGDISFYYREKNDSVVLINEYREACTVLCDWSNDGMLFMTASTYPRMKVENVFKIYTYEGNLVSTSNFNELYDVKWKNCLAGVFREPPKPKVNLVDSKKNVYKVKTSNVDKKDETSLSVLSSAAMGGDAYGYRRNSKSEKEKETDKREKEKDSNKDKGKGNKSGSPVIKKEKQQNLFDLDVNWRNKNNRVKKEGTEKEGNQQDKENKKDMRKTDEKFLKKKNIEYETGDISTKSDTKRSDRRNTTKGMENEKGKKEEIEAKENRQKDESGETQYDNLRGNIKELISSRTGAPMEKNEKQRDAANINAAEWERMYELLERTDDSRYRLGMGHDLKRNPEFQRSGIRFGNPNVLNMANVGSNANNIEERFTKKEKVNDTSNLMMQPENFKHERNYRAENEVIELMYAENSEHRNGESHVAPYFIPKFGTDDTTKMEQHFYVQRIQMLKKLGVTEKQRYNNLHTSEAQQFLQRENASPFLNYEHTQMRTENNAVHNNIDLMERRNSAEEYQEAVFKHNKALSMYNRNMTTDDIKESMNGKNNAQIGMGIAAERGRIGGKEEEREEGKKVDEYTEAAALRNSKENNLRNPLFNNVDSVVTDEEYFKRITAQFLNEDALNEKEINYQNKNMNNPNSANRNILNKLNNNKCMNSQYLRELDPPQNDNNKNAPMLRSKMTGMMHLQNGNSYGRSANANNNSNTSVFTNRGTLPFGHQENSAVVDIMRGELSSNAELLNQMHIKKEDKSASGSEITSNEDIVNLFKKMLPHAKVNVVTQDEMNSQNRKPLGTMQSGQVRQNTSNTLQLLSEDRSQHINIKREDQSNSNNFFDEQMTFPNKRNTEVNDLVELEEENYMKDLLMKQGIMHDNPNSSALHKPPNLTKGGRRNNTENISNNSDTSVVDSNNTRSIAENQEEQLRMRMRNSLQSQMQPHMNRSNVNGNTNANANANISTTDPKQQLNKLNFYELLKCYYTLNVHQIQIRLMWVNLKIENYGEHNINSKNPVSIEKEKSILCKLKEMEELSEYISVLLKQFFLNNREKYEDTLKEFSNVILYQDKVFYEKLNELMRRHSDKPYVVSFIKNIDKIIEYYWSHNEDSLPTSMNNEPSGRDNFSINNKNELTTFTGSYGRRTGNSISVNTNVAMPSSGLHNGFANLKNNIHNGSLRKDLKNGYKTNTTSPLTSNTNNHIVNSSNSISGNGNSNNTNKTISGNSLQLHQFEFQKRLLQQKKSNNLNFLNTAITDEEQNDCIINNNISTYAPKRFLPNKTNLSDGQKLALLYRTMNLNEQDTNFAKMPPMSNEIEKQRIQSQNEYIHNDMTNFKDEQFINRPGGDCGNEFSSLRHIRQAMEAEINQKLENRKIDNDVTHPDEALLSKKFALCDMLQAKEQLKINTADMSSNDTLTNNATSNINSSNTNNNNNNKNNSTPLKNAINSSVEESYLEMKKLNQESGNPHLLKQNIHNTPNGLTEQLKNLLNINMCGLNKQIQSKATSANQLNKMYEETKYMAHVHQAEHENNESFRLNQISTKHEGNKMRLSDINIKQEQKNKQMPQLPNMNFSNFKNSSSNSGRNRSGNNTTGMIMGTSNMNISNNSPAFKIVGVTENDIYSLPRDCNADVIEGLYTKTGRGQNVLNNQVELSEGTLRNENKERAVTDKKYVNESELREYFLNEKNKIDAKNMFMGTDKENALNISHPLILNESINMNEQNNIAAKNAETPFDIPKKNNHLFDVRDTKRPDAVRDKCWQYVDLKGVVQGPFYLEEMRVWSEMGFFEPMLPVRCCDMDRFVALNKLFPPPVKPFTTVPKPQPMLQWEEDVL